MNNKLFEGLLVIVIGVLLLLNNLHIISFDLWLIFSYYWPLLLIAYGLRLIFHNSTLIQIIVFFLLVVIPVVHYFQFVRKFLPHWV